MKTIIAVPCMDTLETMFVQSLVNSKHIGQMMTALLPGSIVHASRNKLVQLAIVENADYLLFVDSDMVFGEDVIARLIQEAEANDAIDILCPLMFRRRAPFSPVMYSKIRVGAFGQEHEAELLENYPVDSTFEVDACGCGMMLIKRRVLESMLENKAPFFSPIPGFGEDISFCIRAKENGFHIFVDSSIKIGHISRTVVTEDTYFNYLDDH